MVPNVRRGFFRVCVVLSALATALAIGVEFAHHDVAFLKDFECLPEPARELFSIDDGFCKVVKMAVEKGFISEDEGHRDIGIVAGTIEWNGEHWVDAQTGESLDVGANSQRQIAVAAPIKKNLDKLMASGKAQVPLHRRLDRGPLEHAIYAIVVIWLVYGIGIYLGAGFSS